MRGRLEQSTVQQAVDRLFADPKQDCRLLYRHEEGAFGFWVDELHLSKEVFEAASAGGFRRLGGYKHTIENGAELRAGKIIMGQKGWRGSLAQFGDQLGPRGFRDSKAVAACDGSTENETR